MDGNRRWASRRGLSSIVGHKNGADTLKNIITKSVELGIKELTLFVFSTENWTRVPSEINGLFKLIERYLKSEIAEICQNNIKVNFIGDRSEFNNKLKAVIDNAEKVTVKNDKMLLNFAFNYGGKADLLHAVKSINKDITDGKISSNDINEDLIRNYLMSYQVKDFDLLIRTSGEKRVSNFFPWQISYAEIYFTETYWPDFTPDEFEKAVRDYSMSERRFGGSKVTISRLRKTV